MNTFWWSSLILSFTLAILCNFMCSYLMDTYDTVQVKKALETLHERHVSKLSPVFVEDRLVTIEFRTAAEEVFRDLSNLLFTLFNTALGIVIIPILGRNLVTVTLHGVVLLAAFISFVFRFFMIIENSCNFFEEYQCPVYLLLIFYIIQLISIFASAFTPERFLLWRREEFFRHHGVFGVLIFITLLFNFFLHVGVISKNHEIVRKSTELNGPAYYLFQLLPWFVLALVYLYALLVLSLVLVPFDEIIYEYHRVQSP